VRVCKALGWVASGNRANKYTLTLTYHPKRTQEPKKLAPDIDIPESRFARHERA